LIKQEQENAASWKSGMAENIRFEQTRKGRKFTRAFNRQNPVSAAVVCRFVPRHDLPGGRQR